TKKLHDQIHNTDDASIEVFTDATNYLRARLPLELSTPKVAIICGSGLGQLADIIQDKVEFAYEDIPGFVSSTALSRDFKTGMVGVISDHISFPGLAENNPLFGPNISAFGTRFPPMSDAYDYDLRVIAFKAAKSLNFPKETLKEAIYTFYIIGKGKCADPEEQNLDDMKEPQ
ncbi:10802_t:CDS:2, partial [Racocetra fulgida]